MDEFFLEAIEKNLDTKAKLSIYVSSTQQWIKGIKILSVANDTLRYTYYEINPKEKPPVKRLMERLTPIYFILDVKLEHQLEKEVKDLNKDYQAEYIEENFFDEDDDDFIHLS